MLPEFGIMKSMWSRRTALVIMAAGFAACVDDSVAPAPDTMDPAQTRVLGFAELTFSGIGTPDFSSSLIMAPTMEALEELRAQRDRSGDFRDLVTQDLTFPDNSGGGGNGTIQLAQPQKSEFTLNGVRYLRTTLNVRNAQANGTAYDTPRNNLTFLAVGTSSTINGTALSKLELAGGVAAPPALALQVMPTVRVELDTDSLTVPDPDVLQILRESELTAVAANAPPAVTNVFPYGFVVRNASSTTSRTLPASPGPGQFDGVIDFAFSIPVQSQPADDPQKISVLMLAVDDSETRVTQGLQEQNLPNRLALQQRAGSLSADTMTLLPGGSVPGFAGGFRTLCSVRTAGTSGAPAAHLVNASQTLTTIFPTAGTFIASNATIGAVFSASVNTAGPATFTVRGLQSGAHFLGQVYSGNGTPSVETPSGASYFPGEELEVVLTSGLSCVQPTVARYRVQSSPTSEGFAFSGVPYSVGGQPQSVALADLTGNDTLDIITANQSGTISVLLGNGDGTFPATSTDFPAGSTPFAVAVGDLNRDGALDAVAANSGSTSNNISVFIGDGSGGFATPAPTSSVGTRPQSVAIGDLNRNGILDVVTANNGSSNVSVLLGNGDGTFQNSVPIPAGSLPVAVELGNVNADGILDIVVANNFAGFSVLLGNGDGTFQSATSHAAGGSVYGLAIGDVDNNGTLDAVAANQTASQISVVLGDGTGGFGSATSFSAGVAPHDVTLADVNGNGNLDAVVADQSASSVRVLIGNGSGGFGSPQTSSVGGFPQEVALGDLTGTGILDIVAADRNGNNVSVVLRQTP